MSSIAVSCVVFACVFSGALLGMFLQGPLLATLAALVLGLLIASAKNAYDTQNNEIKQMSASILLLDRVLAHYGPETKEARDLLRRTIAGAVDRIWPENSSRPANLAPLTNRRKSPRP